MTRKENIIQQLKNGANVLNFKDFLHDKDIALQAVLYNPESLAHMPHFHSDKDFFVLLVQKNKQEALIFMDTKLKEDFDFALKLEQMNPDTLAYFSPKIRHKEEFLKNAEANLQDYIFLGIFLYENNKDRFNRALLNSPNAYGKLPRHIRLDKEVILTTYASPKANVYSVDFIGLPDELKLDFDISVAILNHLRPTVIYYKSILQRLKKFIKIDEYFEKFTENYTATYNKHLVSMLYNNKNFKKQFGNLLEDHPNQEDYKPFIRQQKLHENLLKDEEKKVVNKKMKI